VIRLENIYKEIVNLLKSKGERLGMDVNSVSYKSESDPGPEVPGYTTKGTSETINIPDEYMTKAGATNSQEFLNWLKTQ